MSLFENDGEEYWIPLADVMTGLMLIFILIAVSYMLKIHHQEQVVNKKYQLLVEHRLNNPENNPSKLLVKSLKNELGSSLLNWQASLDEDNLLVRFSSPTLMFATGSQYLKPEFKQTLAEFYPRYLQALKPYESSILVVSIDGYSSSIWNNTENEDEAYFKNLQLSQQRSGNVLHYLFDISFQQESKQWLRSHFTANGGSSSHQIFDTDGNENFALSQRVEFKIILKK